jgi:hypothetical protein
LRRRTQKGNRPKDGSLFIVCCRSGGFNGADALLRPLAQNNQRQPTLSAAAAADLTALTRL